MFANADSVSLEEHILSDEEKKEIEGAFGMEVGTEPNSRSHIGWKQREGRRLCTDSEPDRYVQTDYLYS